MALLKPREQMFGDDLAYAFLLGTALLHDRTTPPRGRSTSTAIFGAGESAEAHLLMGIAHLGQQDYPAAKTELERAVKLNPQAADGALALRPRAAGARRAGRGRARLPPGARLQRQRLRGQPAAREHAQVGAEVRRSVDLSRARDDDPPERSDRAQAAREPAAADRPGRGSRRDARSDREGRARRWSKRTCSSPPRYNRLKRKDDAERERAIVDRLNAEAQAKQRGAGPADREETGR